ncbi:histidine kinase, partial [Aureobasidium melanogenum]
MPTFGWQSIESPHAQFIRSVDWSATSIGPLETWPHQLHQMIDLIMLDPTPSAIMWGDDLTMIYNDGFVEFAGEKHPKLMGGTPMVSYAEVWEPQFAPIVALGREKGQATRHKDIPLFLRRHGYNEEVFVDYTFIPLTGNNKEVVGFYHTAVETTDQNLAKRRTQTLIDIGNHAGGARDMAHYWDAVLKGFEANIWDIPYAIAYEFHNDDAERSSTNGSEARSGSRSRSTRSSSYSDSVSSSGRITIPRACSLAGVIGRSMTQVPLGFDVALEEPGFHQVVKKAISSGEPVLLEISHEKTPDWLKTDTPGRAFEELITHAVVMPIRPTTRNDSEGLNAIGFVVMGLNPRRKYDTDYQRYTRLWSQQLATSAASVVLLEQENKRQMQLKAQLSINELRFSRFAEMSNVAMWILEPNGTLVYGNQTWHDQMDLSDGSILTEDGQPMWMDCVADETKQAVADAWKSLTQDQISTNIEMCLKPNSKTKQYRWVLSSAFPELAEDGTLKAVWGCNTDISHQKLAEELKEQRLLDVLEAKRQSESFIDTVSHEMRNPLSAILQCADGVNTSVLEARGSSSNGKHTQFDREGVDYILESTQTIILCAQHQKRIINDILTLSKLDARLLEVTPTEVDPVETVKHALRLYQQECQNADIDSAIRVDQSYNSLAVDRVYVDPSRLLQVLINLLGNAIKFTQHQDQRKVTVTISASLESPAVKSDGEQYFFPRASKQEAVLGADWGTGEDLFLHFSVNDTGVGLTSDEMKNLFLRFSQASPKTHVTYGGSGLGLFICKELAELQGGRIGVSSTPGKGSDFKFYVKARRAATSSRRETLGLEDTAAKRPRQGKSPQNDQGSPHDGQKSQEETTRLHVTHPNYVAPLNRSHSASQNPIVGSPSDANTLHVLIVEDNLINQKVMAQQLKKAKCEVHVANHGADALLFLEKTSFAKDCGPYATPLSIILMDLEMPVMDGLTCIRRIRDWQKQGKLTRPVPVIAVTANARNEQITMAQEAGMDDVVTKPFKISELIPKMHTLIEKIST